MKRTLLTSTVIVLVAVLLAIAVPLVPRSSYAQESTPANESGGSTPEGAAPDTIIASNPQPGIYFIDGGAVDMSPAVFPVDGAVRFYNWQTLNPTSGGYRWDDLDAYIAGRKAQGLETGIMLDTYGGSGSGDIRKTPDFVIANGASVLPATNADGTLSYASYWRRASYNADFDWTNPAYGWLLAGDASIAAAPAGTIGKAARLGGVDSAVGRASHAAERIPVMPASLSGTLTAYVEAAVYIETTDSNPNDHLYVELWAEKTDVQIGTIELDINNLSHPPNTWKTYRFDVSTIAHGLSPRVTFRVVNDGANPTTFWVDNVALFVRHLIPNYESSDFLTPYMTFIQALGNRYKGNLDLEFVAMGTGLFGENQPTEDAFDHVVFNAGLTSADWVKVMNQITDKYAFAFRVEGLGLTRSVLMQYAPYYKSATERKDSTDHAAGMGVGLSSNFLAPDYIAAYRTDGVGAYDPIEAHWKDVPVAFESYKSDLCSPVLAFYALASGLDKHVDYLRVDPPLLRESNGNPTLSVEEFRWAKQYLGKSAQTTPRVFTVMREHRNPTRSNCRGDADPNTVTKDSGLNYLSASATYSNWPQLGNYNFFLWQDDSVAGGKTVAETNDKGADSTYAQDPETGALWKDAGLGNCPANKSYDTALFPPDYPCNPHPYNPNLPAIEGQGATYKTWYNPELWQDVNGDGIMGGMEAYVVRRTDQKPDPALDNPFMFFRIASGYVDSTKVYSATITVKYFDIGTDSWSLKYDSLSGEKVARTKLGADSVKKTGDNQLKTVQFIVEDAKFAKRLTGLTDFYLDSRNPATDKNDGNEWIHMVEVEKGDPRAEPTPTSTPTTGSVQGSAYHDVNGNGSRDAGEPGVAGAVMGLSDLLTPDKYTATSGADGTYRFDGVSAGQYTLREKTAPPGYLKNTAFELNFVVQANSTFTQGTNIGHTATPTVTPTATATATATPGTPVAADEWTYLPIVLR